MPLQIPFLKIIASGLIQVNSSTAQEMNWIGNYSGTNTIPRWLQLQKVSGSINNCASSLLLNDLTIQTIPLVKYNLFTDNDNYLIFNLDSSSSNSAFSHVGNFQMMMTNVNGTAASVEAKIYGFYLV